MYYYSEFVGIVLHKGFLSKISVLIQCLPPPPLPGGICDNPITQNGIQKTLNTGIVTNLNFARQIPPSLSVLTFAHEVGHNFGSNVSQHNDGYRYLCHSPSFPPSLLFSLPPTPSSLSRAQHDPMDSPPDGAYIMSAFATDGSQPNNDNFSPRSVLEMTPVVRTRGQDAGI